MSIKDALDAGDENRVLALTSDVKAIVSDVKRGKARLRCAVRALVRLNTPRGDAQIEKWAQNDKWSEHVMLGLTNELPPSRTGSRPARPPR